MSDISISVMRPSEAARFSEIWIPWLRDSMGRVPEQEDLRIMASPLTYYREQGGEVFVAHLKNEVVGVVAVKSIGGGNYEFAKLVVHEAARGLGIGRMLVQRCLIFVSECAGKALYLQSFYALNTAIQLYKRMGFIEVDAPDGMHVLARTEIVMKAQSNTSSAVNFLKYSSE